MKGIVKVLAELVAETCNWRVVWFATRMQATLTRKRKRGKSGWEGMEDYEILERLQDELEELSNAVTNKEKIDEAVDIANFAMFFAMRYVDSEGEIIE